MNCDMDDCENAARVVVERYMDGKQASICLAHYCEFMNDGLKMQTIGYIGREEEIDHGSPLVG